MCSAEKQTRKYLWNKRSHTLADVLIDFKKSLPVECAARLRTCRNKTSEILSPPTTSISLLSKTKKKKKGQLNKRCCNKSQRMWNHLDWKMCTSCKQMASVSSKIHLTLQSWPGSDLGSSSPHNPLTNTSPCCPGDGKLSQQWPFDQWRKTQVFTSQTERALVGVKGDGQRRGACWLMSKMLIWSQLWVRGHLCMMREKESELCFDRDREKEKEWQENWKSKEERKLSFTLAFPS